MYGCKFCEMDGEHVERCVLTGEPTNGAVLCDFEFEDRCDLYKAEIEKKRSQRSERSEKPKLMQTSVFGVAGEQPFRG